MTHFVVSEERQLESEGRLCTRGGNNGVPGFRNIADFSPRCAEPEPLPDMCL